jgi:F420-non-reducing hydrogenase iron-sulfur subunit
MSNTVKERKRAKKQQKTHTFEPKVLVFACNWCSYAGADNAGISRIQYSSNVRLLRTMCSGRVHPSFVLQAFAEGSDGVIVSGCHFGDCHYMFGNYKAVDQYEKLKKLVQTLGIEPERIALEWISAAEGPRFAEVINSFVDRIHDLGPSPLAKRNGK